MLGFASIEACEILQMGHQFNHLAHAAVNIIKHRLNCLYIGIQSMTLIQRVPHLRDINCHLIQIGSRLGKSRHFLRRFNRQRERPHRLFGHLHVVFRECQRRIELVRNTRDHLA